MRRWNGWGASDVVYPVPESARRYLVQRLGNGPNLPDATLAAVLDTVPLSRLGPVAGVNCEPQERLLHARGQSLPDWIALRSGHVGAFPDGVAYPESAADVRALLEYARQTGTHLIPYGGGTSVVGHITPNSGATPVLTVDLARLNRLVALDETSRLATFEAGVRGPELEAGLRERGYTLGHYPQSFEYSTLGGWIATRSSGQQSYHYGRIEALFAGGTLETPRGPMVMPPLPASAAGPDLRQLVLGSEGRLGVLTQATVRVRPLAEVERFQAVFFHDWTAGVAAIRQIAQAQVAVSMLRLSDAQETETTLTLSGRDRLVAWADRGLRVAGYGPERCLLVFGVTGDRVAARQAQDRTIEIARSYGGLPAGAAIGEIWRKTRFRTPYLRNTLWELGYAVDTVETAVPWNAVQETAQAVISAIRDGLTECGERVYVFAHLSHVYLDGAATYVTYLYRRSADPDETLRRWQVLKGAASRAITAHGGTISHQHGVGSDHQPYLLAEKGPLGLELLAAAQRTLDPDGLLNPGKLVP